MIILDTHAWIFWLKYPDKLSKKATDVINKADSVGVSVFSFLEAGLLIRKKKIRVSPSPGAWFEKVTSLRVIQILPMTPEIAFQAAVLENFHADPADRVIASTCLTFKAPLITKDRKISSYPSLKTIW